MWIVLKIRELSVKVKSVQGRLSVDRQSLLNHLCHFLGTRKWESDEKW